MSARHAVVGDAVRRREDRRLLCGTGAYVDDLTFENLVHAVMVRSPHPHASIHSVDVDAAATLPGVIGVYRARDVIEDGLGEIPCVPMQHPTMWVPDYPLLCHDTVRFQGDAVAMVVAETLGSAIQAAELVDVEYQALAALTDVSQALSAAAPRVHAESQSNLCFEFEQGDEACVEDAFGRAAHVTTLRLVNNRVVPSALEPRGALGVYDAESERFTLYTGTQTPHLTQQSLAKDVLKIPPERLRVVVNDVGGGFGAKAPLYREQALVLWAAGKIGRPVKWTAERTESFSCDTHGRDTVTDAALAIDREGRMLGLRVQVLANMGAYLSYYAPIPATGGIVAFAGLYRIPAIHVHVDAAFTHTVMMDAYRGAGRPEAIYVVERLVDKAARELGMSPLELRRRNYIASSEMPYQTALGTVYDSGAFEENMDRAVQLADWAGFGQRRTTSEDLGRRRGIGMATYVERAGGGLDDSAEIVLDEQGRATALLGTMSTGQGHETAYAQLVADALGLPMERVTVVQGDTDRVSSGRGTFGSRSLPIGGSALVLAAERLIERAKHIAAHQLEVHADDVDFAGGEFRVTGTDRKLGWGEVARSVHDAMDLQSDAGPGLSESASFKPTHPTFPNGCHICEIEIDPDTGELEINRYTAVDDFGRIINPMLVDGQVHGGIAQGVGQAMLEQTVYCPQTGQLLSGSLMDYCLPRADDFPDFDSSCNEVPCLNNPLGVKGCGEAGAIAAPPALMNAIVDALAPLGVAHLDMPATPARIWEALAKA